MGHAAVYNVWNCMSVRPVWNKNDVLTYDDKLMFLEKDMILLQAHSHPISIPACPLLSS